MTCTSYIFWGLIEPSRKFTRVPSTLSYNWYSLYCRPEAMHHAQRLDVRPGPACLASSNLSSLLRSPSHSLTFFFALMRYLRMLLPPSVGREMWLGAHFLTRALDVNLSHNFLISILFDLNDLHRSVSSMHILWAIGLRECDIRICSIASSPQAKQKLEASFIQWNF